MNRYSTAILQYFTEIFDIEIIAYMQYVSNDKINILNEYKSQQVHENSPYKKRCRK